MTRRVDLFSSVDLFFAIFEVHLDVAPWYTSVMNGHLTSRREAGSQVPCGAPAARLGEMLIGLRSDIGRGRSLHGDRSGIRPHASGLLVGSRLALITPLSRRAMSMSDIKYARFGWCRESFRPRPKVSARPAYVVNCDGHRQSRSILTEKRDGKMLMGTKGLSHGEDGDARPNIWPPRQAYVLDDAVRRARSMRDFGVGQDHTVSVATRGLAVSIVWLKRLFAKCFGYKLTAGYRVSVTRNQGGASGKHDILNVLDDKRQVLLPQNHVHGGERGRRGRSRHRRQPMHRSLGQIERFCNHSALSLVDVTAGWFDPRFKLAMNQTKKVWEMSMDSHEIVCLDFGISGKVVVGCQRVGKVTRWLAGAINSTSWREQKFMAEFGTIYQMDRTRVNEPGLIIKFGIGYAVEKDERFHPTSELRRITTTDHETARVSPDGLQNHAKFYEESTIQELNSNAEPINRIANSQWVDAQFSLRMKIITDVPRNRHDSFLRAAMEKILGQKSERDKSEKGGNSILTGSYNKSAMLRCSSRGLLFSHQETSNQGLSVPRFSELHPVEQNGHTYLWKASQHDTRFHALRDQRDIHKTTVMRITNLSFVGGFGHARD